MGFSIHVILATDLYAESLTGDEPEPLEVVRWPMSELDSLFRSDQLTEARSIAALTLARMELRS